MIDSLDTFLNLLNSDDSTLRRQALVDSAPLEVWKRIVELAPGEAKWVALNKTIPTAIMELLALDKSEDVRSCLATRRALTRPLFELLANDTSERVRANIARNKKAPLDIVEALANDGNEFVASVAKNRLEPGANLSEADH